MANHIKNRLTLKGSKQQIGVMLAALSTFFPTEPSKSYDGDLIYENKETKQFGWFNPETNVFRQRDEEDRIGVPDGFVQEFSKEWTRFPDFEKVIPPPNDPAYRDEPSQEAVRDNPNWWYTWNIAHWGTKWNAYECEKLEENVFQFETAWSSVPDLIEAISLKHPEVEITYEYADEDTGYNCGTYVFKNGFSKGKPLENGSIEAYELAFKLRPDYAEYYELKDGEYVGKED